MSVAFWAEFEITHGEKSLQMPKYFTTSNSAIYIDTNIGEWGTEKVMTQIMKDFEEWNSWQDVVRSPQRPNAPSLPRPFWERSDIVFWRAPGNPWGKQPSTGTSDLRSFQSWFNLQMQMQSLPMNPVPAPLFCSAFNWVIQLLIYLKLASKCWFSPIEAAFLYLSLSFSQLSYTPVIRPQYFSVISCF